MTKLLEIINKDKDYSLPLFLVIDELDRCRPNYAIEFLEIVKHIFDIPNIIFVIATDSQQLSHAINAVYGDNFASERYLKRFFDQEYTLKTPSSYDYCYSMFKQYGLLENEKLFSGLDKELYEGKDLNVVLFSAYQV